MQIYGATQSQPAEQKSDSSATLGGEMGDMFLKLLTTQLKAQDPISPMNPTEFVGQLVQFNTLGQIVAIRELLEPQNIESTRGATAPAIAGGK
ncbi:MAG TPA: flagellar hook capping FlgD N-terminal domain-containing protein [Clostridia bacterium]|nr:flagellar hook capping FlgD N-terminal domain-containing protein [Clostridia bacterium]